MARHLADPDHDTLLCRACGTTCDPVGRDGWRHSRPRCGAVMRYDERCARLAGHSEIGSGRGHRSRFALDNAAIAANGHAPRRLAA